MKQDKGGYTGLADLRDGEGNKINLSDFNKTASNMKSATNPLNDHKPNIPNEYIGKTWDQLYQADKLETIRTEYPAHYEKLRKEKFKNNH